MPESPAATLLPVTAYAGSLSALLGDLGLELAWVEPGQPIPGSYWGEREAGLVGNTLWLRGDTPLHSALHEAAHWVCMDENRRAVLHTDAGGDFAEEDAVCYLQLVWAEGLGLGWRRLAADMDAWGYTFRLGSAALWFEQDAADARQWLIRHGVLSDSGTPTGRVRGPPHHAPRLGAGS